MVRQCAVLGLCASLGFGASAEVAACEVETSRAASSMPLDHDSHRFNASGDDFEIQPNGSGTRGRADGTHQAFDLPLPEHFFIEEVHWSTIDGDLLIVYGTSDGEHGAGRVVRLDKSDLLPVWVAAIPSFNVGEPLCAGTSLFVTSIGWIGKIDLLDGKLLWQHKDLYERASGAFNSFSEPVLQANEIRFAENRSRDRHGPHYALVVDAESGQLLRREERPQNEGYPGDVAIIELGRAGDLAGLEKARKLYLAEATPTQRFAIHLASRLASPTQFADELVDSIPDKPGEGWLNLDDVDGWVGEFFIATELANIAATGNPAGIHKLVQLTTWADGAWSEILDGGIARCLIDQTDMVIDALANRTPQERLRVLESAFALGLLDEDVEPLLSAVRGARTRHPALQLEIENLAMTQLAIRRGSP
jgi:hypothetical protein